MKKTYQSFGALCLIALMPMSAIANQVSDRGAGGYHPQQYNQHNYQAPVNQNDNRNNNNYDNRNDNNYDNRNNPNYYNGYGGWNEGGAAYPVAPVAPVYPVYPGYGGYLPNENPFPDQSQEDAIYRQNQHRGE